MSKIGSQTIDEIKATCLKTVHDLVVNEKKNISYKWVAYKYNVNVNLAKVWLDEIYSKNPTKFSVFYLLTGMFGSTSDYSSYGMKIVSETQVSSTKEMFTTLTGMHVYALSPFRDGDMDVAALCHDVHLAEKTLLSALYSAKPEDHNSFRANSLSSIANPMVSRSESGMSAPKLHIPAPAHFNADPHAQSTASSVFSSAPSRQSSMFQRLPTSSSSEKSPAAPAPTKAPSAEPDTQSSSSGNIVKKSLAPGASIMNMFTKTQQNPSSSLQSSFSDSLFPTSTFSAISPSSKSTKTTSSKAKVSQPLSSQKSSSNSSINEKEEVQPKESQEKHKYNATADDDDDDDDDEDQMEAAPIQRSDVSLQSTFDDSSDLDEVSELKQKAFLIDFDDDEDESAKPLQSDKSKSTPVSSRPASARRQEQLAAAVEKPIDTPDTKSKFDDDSDDEFSYTSKDGMQDDELDDEDTSSTKRPLTEGSMPQAKKQKNLKRDTVASTAQSISGFMSTNKVEDSLVRIEYMDEEGFLVSKMVRRDSPEAIAQGIKPEAKPEAKPLQKTPSDHEEPKKPIKSQSSLPPSEKVSSDKKPTKSGNIFSFFKTQSK